MSEIKSTCSIINYYYLPAQPVDTEFYIASNASFESGIVKKMLILYKIVKNLT